jgi:hypothetical protein
MSRQQIVVIGDLYTRHEEKQAAEALKPGHLIMGTAAGKFQKHNVAGGNFTAYVAKENGLLGKTKVDAYAVDDIVFGHRINKDNVVQIRIAAGAIALLKEDAVVSAGDGTVMKRLIGEGNLYQNVAASANVTNTTVETAFDKSYTIPAKSLRVGDVIDVEVRVSAPTTNSTDTLTLKLKIGTTVLVATGAVNVADGDVGILRARLTIRTIGASGTFVSDGEWALGVPGTAAFSPYVLASTAIDTTATQAITATATWSVASASNIAALQTLGIGLERTGDVNDNVIGFVHEDVDNSAEIVEGFAMIRGA